MNILQTLQQLRDDLKLWVTNNLNALNAKIDEKTIPIDSELDSTSTNPVQNKAISKEINNINNRVGDKSVATQISNAIAKQPHFSGDYNDLTNAPNITEDDNGNMVIADESGNVIFKADADGIHTTALSLNGEAAATETYVNEAVASIEIPETDLTNYYTKSETDTAIDTAKEELSESIVAESEEWKVVDETGNIIFSVDASGAHTTSLTLNGQSVEDIIDEKAVEKVASVIDSAPDTLNTLNELANALGDDPNFATTVATEIGKKVDKVDGKGLSANDFTDDYKNVLDNLGSMAFEETDPTVPEWAKSDSKPEYTAEEVNALPNTTVLADLAEDETHRTVTDTEKEQWNSKSDFSGAYTDLIDAPNITENESGDFIITDEFGNIILISNDNGLETTKITTQDIFLNGININEVLVNKADLVDGKVPIEQLPESVSGGYASNEGAVLYNASQSLSEEEKIQARENIGAIGIDDIGESGGVSIQADYNEDNPNSPSHIKNRPFYEGRITSHFSSDDTPEPQKFPAIGYTWFKVSELMPKGEEVFNTTFTYYTSNLGSVPFKPTPSHVIASTDDFVGFMLDMGGGNQLGYIIAYNTGTFSTEYMGMPVEFTAEETGVYIAWKAETLDPGVTVDIEYYGIKKIDPKYLPEPNSGITHFSSTYKQEDNPEPLYIEGLGMKWFKVSDLTPTIEEVFATKFLFTLYGETFEPEFKFTNVEQLHEHFIGVYFPSSGIMMGISDEVGEFSFSYQGIPVTVSNEQTGKGIYVAFLVGSMVSTETVPEGTVIDISFTRDENAKDNEILTIEIDASEVNLSEDSSIYLTKEQVVKARQIIVSKKPAFAKGTLKITDSAPLSVWFTHNALGFFTAWISTLMVLAEYNDTTETVILSLALSNPSGGTSTTSTTYGLRKPQTLADFIKQSMEERGLIKT